MPERTAFVRFRRLLVAHHLDRALFDAVGSAHRDGDRGKTSTIVDATIIASASEEDGYQVSQLMTHAPICVTRWT